MSRVGKLPVNLPDGVSVTLDGQSVQVKGPKGQLSMVAHSDVAIKQEDGAVTVSPLAPNSNFGRAIWATTRALINNMVEGVTNGFSRVLELKGVGYRAQLQGKELVMQLGYSHDVRYQIPEGIDISVDKQTVVTVSGIDKQLVGQVATNIRSYRPPEPYKGKGVKYQEERIIRKEGKKK